MCWNECQLLMTMGNYSETKLIFFKIITLSFNFIDCSTLGGFVSLKYLTKKMVSQNYQLDKSIENAMYQQFYRVKKDTALGLISRILETEEFVGVVDDSNHITGVINHLDLLNFISKSVMN